jgi:hypothetical protein
MELAEAQREMREVYLNAAPGQAVAAAVWLLSATCATWVSVRAAVIALVLGGMLIYPGTQLILLAMRRPTSVTPANPLRELAPEVALVVPLVMPLAGAAMLHRVTWFYPAFMVIVGAHYLPFSFLYGRRAFLVLAGLLLIGGFGLAFAPNAPFALGAWLTGGALAVFAIASIPRSGDAKPTTPRRADRGATSSR